MAFYTTSPRGGSIRTITVLLDGSWPPASLVLCLTNDLIWWIPFGIYLADAWPAFRADLAAGRSG